MRISTRLSAATITLLLVAAPVVVIAASGDLFGPTGSIAITQEAALGFLPAWTLINAQELKLSGNDAQKTLSVPAGTYTFFVEQPKGFITTINIFRGTTLVQTAETPQISFTYDAAESLKIDVRYVLKYSGMVSVTSTPGGVDFELRGPNAMLLKGVTPKSYDALPIGQYSVRFLPNGCNATPPKSDELQYQGRVNFSVTLVCDGLSPKTEALRINENFVTTSDGLAPVAFRDVPKDAWFATYVKMVSERKIMTGFRGSDGAVNAFGPAEKVTLAQLAKITHELTGIDESAVAPAPFNHSAPPWSLQYIASAEAQDWIAYLNPNTDLNRPATRAEVVATFLQALDVPLQWPKGVMFRDVNRRTTYAAAIETAAKAGVVSGKTDTNGTATGFFGPDDPITRAEIAKIIMQTIDKFKLAAK